jgi:hypothetical protein
MHDELERSREEVMMVFFTILSRIALSETQENNVKPQSGYLVSLSRIEPVLPEY